VQPLVDELNALLDHSERQAEEARRHAGNLAHALKTPLTVLTNAATARAPDLGDAVMRETRTMQRHVDHHLARARAVGRRALGHARTNVMASAEAVRRAVERLYPEGRLDIAGSRSAEVAIERQDLDEMLGNLIENAAKYSHASRPNRIEVSGRDLAGGWVEIAIADHGRGIAPKDHERIFELFRRSGRQDRPGEGLGLAFVRNSVRRLGGSIDVESALGEGSTFRMKFPKRLILDEAGDTQ
jgi:signal transduction histidine kinase